MFFMKRVVVINIKTMFPINLLYMYVNVVCNEEGHYTIFLYTLSRSWNWNVSYSYTWNIHKWMYFSFIFLVWCGLLSMLNLSPLPLSNYSRWSFSIKLTNDTARIYICLQIHDNNKINNKKHIIKINNKYRKKLVEHRHCIVQSSKTSTTHGLKCVKSWL